MENEKPEIEEIELEEAELYSSTTSCEHYMVAEFEGIAVCSKGCGHGCAYNPETQEVSGGEIREIFPA